MSLLNKLQEYCAAQEIKFMLDSEENIIIRIGADDDEVITIVISCQDNDKRVTFTSINVLNANQLMGLVDLAALYQLLLRINWNFKIGTVQLDSDGEVRLKHSQLTDEHSLSAEQFEFMFNAVAASTLHIRREVKELTTDVVPEALQSVYRSHKLTLQSDDIDTIQLTSIKAVFEGFLAANFSPAFSALLQRDLAIIAAKIDELVPTEF